MTVELRDAYRNITILDNTTTAANESYIVNIFYVSKKDFKNVR